MTMRRRVSLARSVWLLPLLLVAPRAASAEAVDGEHLIIDVQGPASVKRKGWKPGTYVPAVYGLRVQPGDLLKVEPGSRLTVVCGDATRVTLTEPSRVPCRTEGQERKLSASRGPSEQVPTVLSPRATKLLLAPSVLRWAGVAGAREYTVVCRDAETFAVHWRTSGVTKPELTYPKEVPALRPGHTYVLEVTAHKPGKPSADTTSFTLLAPEAARRIQERESRLAQLKLPEAATHLLIASLYARHELYSEALSRLELLTGMPRAAAVERLWSTLYLRIGLPRMALEHAKAAHTLSKDAGDLIGRLDAEETLGLVYKAMGAQDEWTRLLRGVLEEYRALGDSTKVAALKEHLKGSK